ncbi:MAG: peptidoglycan DD-metalloendopeptidase family protein [Budvicia sp.]|nr:peptidoglycan DD-metalloendopeptidase family protein [Budvicia sp.]
MSGKFHLIKSLLSKQLCRLAICSLIFTSWNVFASPNSDNNTKSSLSNTKSGLVLLRYPTAQPFKVTSEFNPTRVNPVTRKVTPHEGIDFSMPIGSAVVSTGAGEVVIAKFSRSAGNYIVIKHGDNYKTQYMHLSKLLVKQGQKIKRGQKIALSGNTGRSTGPHLHYELLVNNKAVNPLSTNVKMADNFSGQLMLASNDSDSSPRAGKNKNIGNSKSASPFKKANGALTKPNYSLTKYTQESSDYANLDATSKLKGKAVNTKGNLRTASTNTKRTLTSNSGKYKYTVNKPANKKTTDLATASNSKKTPVKGNKPKSSNTFQSLSAEVGDFQSADVTSQSLGNGISYSQRIK